MVGACPHCQRSAAPGFNFCPHCGHVLQALQAAPSDPLIGRTLCGGYVVLEIIGTGGMGRVYRAEQSALGRSVAVKLIHAHLIHDHEAAARFVNEARATSKLNHPHVVGVFDFGKTEESLPFIVMEHLRGPSLAQVIEKEQRPAKLHERSLAAPGELATLRQEAVSSGRMAGEGGSKQEQKPFEVTRG